jgi:manganese/zinc/iron transport system substrate-binding protein
MPSLKITKAVVAFALTLGFSLTVSTSLAGCGQATGESSEARAEGEPYRVVATIGMVTDIVRAVAGDRAEVKGLMGTGIDPHLYKPTRSDIERVMSADLIFYNGLLLEGKMTDALIRAATSGKPVHAVTELIDESKLLEPEAFEGLYDPHVWMDPAAWMLAVEAVRDQLIAFDPAGESTYQANADAYLEKLAQLDAYAERALASVPENQRVLVTAHDAFNYFGDRFGYEVVGIQGLSTESEAGVKDIEKLVDLLVDRNIAAVFVESTVSDRNINALIQGANARGHTVRIGGELFSDAMGPAGTYEGTYLGMIDHNATTVAKALGGDVPTGGMQGKLGQH